MRTGMVWARRWAPLAALALAPMLAWGQSPAWRPAPVPLRTRWARLVNPAAPLPEYPRPQMTRARWLNLNGLWQYALTAPDAPPPTQYGESILVPFCYESSLSGVGAASVPDQRLWYRRTFTLPAAWPASPGERIVLHFGAVNWDSSVFLNGQPVGNHRGGYTGFSFDITAQLRPGANELVVSAWNPLRANQPDAQVLGKQRLHPGGIFYTAATGIWQTVWLEPVPAAHITALRLTPDIDRGVLRLTVASTAPAAYRVTALDGGHTVAEGASYTGRELDLPIPNPRLWSAVDPHLYTLKIALDGNGDAVGSYFAMRKISLGHDAAGHMRMLLNNQFVFELGTLDQGYWPAGVYTAPTDAALRYDIEVTKQLGFNLIRKHAKVEPPRWYYWADKLGVVVWQDMPQMFAGRQGALTDDAKAQFEREWSAEIAELYNHPSIIVWTTFNEGWGQHDTAAIVALTKQLDSSRLVNDASGWTDKGVGDIQDTHAYPGPGDKPPAADRATVDGEFGGVTMAVPGHRWTTTQVKGYGKVLDDSKLVTGRYVALLKKVEQLRDQGLSAAVYTQITDVEQEINGLLTYDRALIKPAAAAIRAINLQVRGARRAAAPHTP
ncbi:MAG: glycoside hydrolase family 2 protein [Terriglobales bacterium]